MPVCLTLCLLTVNTYGVSGRMYGWAAAPCKPCARNLITDGITRATSGDQCAWRPPRDVFGTAVVVVAQFPLCLMCVWHAVNASSDHLTDYICCVVCFCARVVQASTTMALATPVRVAAAVHQGFTPSRDPVNPAKNAPLAAQPPTTSCSSASSLIATSSPGLVWCQAPATQQTAPALSGIHQPCPTRPLLLRLCWSALSATGEGACPFVLHVCRVRLVRPPRRLEAHLLSSAQVSWLIVKGGAASVLRLLCGLLCSFFAPLACCWVLTCSTAHTIAHTSDCFSRLPVPTQLACSLHPWLRHPRRAQHVHPLQLRKLPLRWRHHMHPVPLCYLLRTRGWGWRHLDIRRCVLVWLRLSACCCFRALPDSLSTCTWLTHCATCFLVPPLTTLPTTTPKHHTLQAQPFSRAPLASSSVCPRRASCHQMPARSTLDRLSCQSSPPPWPSPTWLPASACARLTMRA